MQWDFQVSVVEYLIIHQKRVLNNTRCITLRSSIFGIWNWNYISRHLFCQTLRDLCLILYSCTCILMLTITWIMCKMFLWWSILLYTQKRVLNNTRCITLRSSIFGIWNWNYIYRHSLCKTRCILLLYCFVYIFLNHIYYSTSLLMWSTRNTIQYNCIVYWPYQNNMKIHKQYMKKDHRGDYESIRTWEILN